MNKQIEAILEGQKQAMEFWTNLSNKFTDSMKPKSSYPGSEFLMDWYKKQQDFFNQMQTGTKNTSMPNLPELYKQWTNLQNDFSKQWASYYDTNSPKWAIDFPSFNGTSVPNKYFEEGIAQWQKWLTDGNKWMNDELISKMPFNMRPHFTNFLDTYDTLQSYWEPITQIIQNGFNDKSLFENYFSMDTYQNMINQLMGFKPVGNVSELIDSVNQWFDSYISNTQKEWGSFTTVSQSWKEQMQESFKMGNTPYFQFATDLNTRLRDQLTPFLNVMAQGKQTETIKLLRDIQFAYITFVLKSSELQSKVYESGQFVLPDLVRKHYEAFQKTKNLPEFQDFFNEYINELENTILEVLSSNQYSVMQSELAKIGTSMKSMTDKVLELMMGDFPFLTKTEGDDIAQETQSLRTKIRTLEARLAKLESSLAGSTVAAPAPKAIPATPKAALFEAVGKATSASKDDLKQIKGIGPKLEKMLNELGIYTFGQLSKMTDTEYDLVDSLLSSFQGRGKRDKWAEQAAGLL
ncbi:MAG: poly(R)-hydroxyalkanoic acid synthase subunit PhaE [Bacteroidota bacterium]